MRVKLLASVVAICFAGPSLADTTSLKAALESAYRTNPALVEAREGQKIIDEGLITAGAGLLPTITGTVSGTLSRTLNEGNQNVFGDGLSITASQLIYDGGRTRDTIEAAQLAILSGRQDLIASEQSVLLSAITAFMNLRSAQAQLGLAENNINVLRQQLQASEDRFEVGEITRTDVALTQSRLASSISNREASKAAVLASIASYQAIIGVPPHRLEAQRSIPALPNSVSNAETIAVRNHPSVLAAALDLESAEVSLRRAKKNRIPTVTGNLNASTGHSTFGGGLNSPTSTASAGISASIPIYQGGRLKSERRTAVATREVRRAQLDRAIITVRANTRTAYANWVAAKSAITARQSQIRASRVAFEGVTEEAKLGARTTLDVLDAEQELQAARSNLVLSLRDEQVAAYSVLSEMGLLSTSQLGLNVVQYQPSQNIDVLKESSPLGIKRLKLLDKLESRR